MKKSSEYCKNFIPFNLSKKESNLVIYQILEIEEEEFKRWQAEANPKEKTVGLRSIFYFN